MVKALDPLVIESFLEFVKYRLHNDLRAFKTQTLPLYPVKTHRFPYKSAFGAPKNQWLYDSSISGAVVPSGVSGLYRGQSGLSVDFINGRILVNTGVPLPSNNIEVSISEFNSYITTKGTSDIILELLPGEPPTVNPNAPIKEDAVVFPAFFCKFTNSHNEPHCLGGMQRSKWKVQLSVFARDYLSLYGFQSVVRDLKDRCAPLLGENDSPLNEFNDIKFEWNYKSRLETASDQSLIHVTDSTFNIIDSDYVGQNLPKVLVGVGSVELMVIRMKTDNYA